MKTWKQTVRCADSQLRLKSKLIENWLGLWTSPFYAWVRRGVMGREDASDVAGRKLDSLLKRRDRIARRYGR